MSATEIGEAAFGGGCHWCTEAVFQHVPGVSRVVQGFAAGPAPEDALSEAALVRWNAADVSLATLIDVHLATHAAQADHTLRARYRSAIYAADPSVRARAEALVRAAGATRAGLVTRVLPLARFEPSPARYRDYYRQRPEAPFCRAHIAPKIARLPGLLRDASQGVHTHAGSQEASTRLTSAPTTRDTPRGTS